MSDDSTLRLVLRGHTIAAEASLAESGAESGGEVFVGLQRPPPVGATLEAYDGERRRLLDVTRIIESDHGGASRGFFGRLREDDGHGVRVGSEHIAAGAPADPADAATDAGGGEPEMASSYPVPAPVLEPEPSEPIDIGHPMEQPAAVATAATGDLEQAAEADDAQPEESAGESGGDAPKRGKKRKGRKRG